MAKRPPEGVIRDWETTSDKIRALGREGYGAAEIARLLKIRYQFAYNVLSRAGLVGRTGGEGEPSIPDIEGDDEAIVDDAVERRFALERDLQRALRENIQQLEAGLENPHVARVRFEDPQLGDGRLRMKAALRSSQT